jgi:hypothetical protein
MASELTFMIPTIHLLLTNILTRKLIGPTFPHLDLLLAMAFSLNFLGAICARAFMAHFLASMIAAIEQLVADPLAAEPFSGVAALHHHLLCTAIAIQ